MSESSESYSSEGELEAWGSMEEDDSSSDAEDIQNQKELILLKKANKKKPEEQKEENTKSNVIYIGHIPWGFFEVEMKSFFRQFGEIEKIRISRNKKTGASKHYAYIQFEDADVAEIAAETMHNYRLWNRRLVCAVVPFEKLHPETFKGANQIFKRQDWRKLHADKQYRKKTPEQTKKKFSQLIYKENKLRKKLVEMGIEYEFSGYREHYAQFKKKRKQPDSETPEEKTSTKKRKLIVPEPPKELPELKKKEEKELSEKKDTTTQKSSPKKGTPKKGTPKKITPKKKQEEQQGLSPKVKNQSPKKEVSNQSKKVTPKKKQEEQQGLSPKVKKESPATERTEEVAKKNTPKKGTPKKSTPKKQLQNKKATPKKNTPNKKKIN